MHFSSNVPITGARDASSTQTDKSLTVALRTDAPAWALARGVPTSLRCGPTVDATTDSMCTIAEFAQTECFEITYNDSTQFVVDRAASLIWGTVRHS